MRWTPRPARSCGTAAIKLLRLVTGAGCRWPTAGSTSTRSTVYSIALVLRALRNSRHQTGRGVSNEKAGYCGYRLFGGRRWLGGRRHGSRARRHGLDDEPCGCAAFGLGQDGCEDFEREYAEARLPVLVEAQAQE